MVPPSTNIVPVPEPETGTVDRPQEVTGPATNTVPVQEPEESIVDLPQEVTGLSTNTVPVQEPEILDALPVMAIWVRGVLLFLVVFLCGVFAIATQLDPYERDDSGQATGARRMETHRQLGLPPCTFYDKTGLPCPSCGMTTSFSLLIRGDVWNSLRANWVGTCLALGCLLFIPWSVASVWVGRTLFVRSVEKVILILFFLLLGGMLLRWGFVLVLRLIGW
jgi:hypothetical protein